MAYIGNKYRMYGGIHDAENIVSAGGHFLFIFIFFWKRGPWLDWATGGIEYISME